MISIVLYGRNDNYGYNLHKRAALSFNCVAELLTDDADEILFVDYNTPDDYPTFPEAIQDTLTPRARRLLRILRVRPAQHQRFKDRTHLVALEPIARNVAVRRSNPANRWILSTNTDMIFVPRHGQSLSDATIDLDDGLYHLPRFEIPETLWETLDRLDPSGTIQKVGTWGRAFHLNEIVHARDAWVKYDGPGDFQLMLRADLFRLSGFHEDMLLGWHVDSNIARRLYLLYGETRDLAASFFGYHCDHTRQVTPAHRWNAVQNDLAEFNDNVAKADLPDQADSWGLAGETVEELTVEFTSRVYVRGLEAAIHQEMVEPTWASYTPEWFGKVNYEVDHVLPFLVDILASYAPDTRLGWFGSRRDLLEAFVEAIRLLGFKSPLMVADGAIWLGDRLPAGCVWEDPAELNAMSDVFVFDCGLFQNGTEEVTDLTNPSAKFLSHWLRRTIRGERTRLLHNDIPPRRFIIVNAINNRVEGFVATRINVARSPMASRIRHGFVINNNQSATTVDLLPQLHVGKSGTKDGRRIKAVLGKPGHVFYGPYLVLEPGSYRLNFSFHQTLGQTLPKSTLAYIEIYADPYWLGVHPVRHADMGRGVLTIDFSLPEELIDAVPWSSSWQRIEFRMYSEGALPLNLIGATLEQVVPIRRTPADYDLLPTMSVGPACDGIVGPQEPLGSFAERSPPGRSVGTEGWAHSHVGEAGHVVYGPYFTLPPGHYIVSFQLWADLAVSPRGQSGSAPVTMDVAGNIGTLQLARNDCRLLPRGHSTHTLEFTIDTAGEAQHIEFRVHSDGTIPFSVQAVVVRRIVPTSLPRETFRSSDNA